MTIAEKIKGLEDKLAALQSEFDENVKQIKSLGDLMEKTQQQVKDAQASVARLQVLGSKHLQLGVALLLLQAQAKGELEQARSESAQQS